MTQSESDFQKQIDDAAGPYSGLTHADRLKTERSLMHSGNVSRSRIRAALQKSAADFQNRPQPAPAQPQTTPRIDIPIVSTTTTGFEPHPFALAPIEPVSTSAVDDPHLLTILDGGDVTTTDATSIDFTGDGVSISNVGSAVTVDIAGPTPLAIYHADSEVESDTHSIAFREDGSTETFGLAITSTAGAVVVKFNPSVKFLSVTQVGSEGSPSFEVKKVTVSGIVEDYDP